MTRTGEQGRGGSLGRDRGACEITGGKVSPGAQLQVAGVWPAEGEGYSGLFCNFQERGIRLKTFILSKEVLRVQCERSATAIPIHFLVNKGLFFTQERGPDKATSMANRAQERIFFIQSLGGLRLVLRKSVAFLDSKEGHGIFLPLRELH